MAAHASTNMQPVDNCYRIQAVRCRPTLSPYGYGMTQDSSRIRQAPSTFSTTATPPAFWPGRPAHCGEATHTTLEGIGFSSPSTSSGETRMIRLPVRYAGRLPSAMRRRRVFTLMPVRSAAVARVS